MFSAPESGWGPVICNISYLEETVSAFREEETITSVKVSRSEKVHKLFLKFGNSVSSCRI